MKPANLIIGNLGDGHLDLPVGLTLLDASLFFVSPDGFQNHTLLDDNVATILKLK